MGSNGLWDNLYVPQVVEIANELLFEGGGGGSHTRIRCGAREVADAVALKAHQKANDPFWPSPYETRYPEDFYHTGGRIDDIFVICAHVVER